MHGMGFLDDAVDRQRTRKDPLGRMPWPLQLLALLLVLALGLGQLALGSGASKALGLLLILVAGPPQALATWAAWRVSREQR